MIPPLASLFASVLAVFQPHGKTPLLNARILDAKIIADLEVDTEDGGKREIHGVTLGSDDIHEFTTSGYFYIDGHIPPSLLETPPAAPAAVDPEVITPENSGGPVASDHEAILPGDQEPHQEDPIVPLAPVTNEAGEVIGHAPAPVNPLGAEQPPVDQQAPEAKVETQETEETQQQ